MPLVTLLLGTNLGKRKNNLTRALSEIEINVGQITNKSGIYETPPWGFKSKNQFLNQVIQIETQLKPLAILKLCKSIEKKMGRTRFEPGYSDRIIDIDIMFYDNLILQSDELIIPHPEIPNRKFVLNPLCEIMPEFIHPLKNQTIQELLQKCIDDSFE